MWYKALRFDILVFAVDEACWNLFLGLGRLGTQQSVSTQDIDLSFQWIHSVIWWYRNPCIGRKLSYYGYFLCSRVRAYHIFSLIFNLTLTFQIVLSDLHFEFKINILHTHIKCSVTKIDAGRGSPKNHSYKTTNCFN